METIEDLFLIEAGLLPCEDNDLLLQRRQEVGLKPPSPMSCFVMRVGKADAKGSGVHLFHLTLEAKKSCYSLLEACCTGRVPGSSILLEGGVLVLALTGVI